MAGRDVTRAPVGDEVLSLDSIASADGIFSIVAMDQRNTLRRMFAGVGVPDPTPDQLGEVKVAVCRALTPLASGILLDPTFGLPAVRAADAIAPGCGLLIAAEPQDRDLWQGEPRVRLQPGQDATWVRSLGGHALKFLMQLRADRPAPRPGEPDLVEEARATVRELATSCRTAGIPLVVENLVYPLPGEEFTPARREDAIVEAAGALDDLGVDLLKLEYPGSPGGARRLAAVLTRPWAVLSAGVPFDQFTEALAVAYDEGGASGFIAGRSVWKEAVGLRGPERDAFFADVARPRLQRLIGFSAGRARPWRHALR